MVGVCSSCVYLLVCGDVFIRDSLFVVCFCAYVQQKHFAYTPCFVLTSASLPRCLDVVGVMFVLSSYRPVGAVYRRIDLVVGVYFGSSSAINMPVKSCAMLSGCDTSFTVFLLDEIFKYALYVGKKLLTFGAVALTWGENLTSEFVVSWFVKSKESSVRR